MNVDGTVFERTFPGQMLEIPERVRMLQGESAFKALNFPDFRGVVMSSSFGPDSFALSEKLIRSKVSGWEVGVCDDASDGTMLLELLSARRVENEFRTVDSWLFDTQRLVPVERSFRNERVLVPGVIDTRIGKKTTYDWIERQGVQLLKSFRQHSDRGTLEVGHVRHIGVQDLEIEFEWLRFNEPLDESFFDDGSKFRSAHSVIELTGLSSASTENHTAKEEK